MQQNLWLYADKETIDSAAFSLISFGAGIFKRAKIIESLDRLKFLKEALDKKEISPSNPEILEYAFENLMDTVRILVFFENYMKAALISQNLCIHKIDHNIREFKKLASEQFSRPIKMQEINEIVPFIVNQAEKKIEHPALKETTIGLNELLRSSYCAKYSIEKCILKKIAQLRVERNKLHFHENIAFTISNEHIMEIEKLNEFVDKTIAKMIN